MKGKFESVGRLLSVVLLITGIMGMAGCGRHSDADESHLLGKKAESGDGYELRTVEYAQTDGKKMKVELPLNWKKITLRKALVAGERILTAIMIMIDSYL